jgi:methyl-accepting chemotaxis protein
VVADEVRTLATNAAARTKKIKELVAAMSVKVGIGVQRADASGVVLSRLVEGLKESASISGEIAEAAKEQAVGTNSVIGSITKAVQSAEMVGGLMSAQSRKSDEIALSLEEVLARLEGLAAAASRQTEEVRALEESFSAVRREVDRNLETVGALDAEMARFKV